MKKAPILENEAERLKALLEYQILETPEEDAFDNLVVMASQVCGTPIAAISLVDKERVWFKAKMGSALTETPRQISFCGHAILDKKVMVVNDLSVDERFTDNPFVSGKAARLRFYAGAPLITPDGAVIGALCVVDQEVRVLSNDQISFLACLSRQVMTQLELKKSLLKSQTMFQELQHCARVMTEQQGIIKSQEKLAALGGLASGIAHEINNPLAILKGLSTMANSMIQSKCSLEDVSMILRKIETNVNRLARVVHTLDQVCSQPMENFVDAKSVEEAFMQAVARKRQQSA